MSNNTRITRSYFIFCIILCVLPIHSCDKNENPVPVTSIQVTIFDIESDPRYQNLRVEGGAALLQRPSDCLGYKCNGIVIYRLKREYSYDDFRAFDVTCTHEANTCAMQLEQGFGDLLTCPCCGSVFTMQYGYMMQGPAKYPLREYVCTYDNGNLRIEN